MGSRSGRRGAGQGGRGQHASYGYGGECSLWDCELIDICLDPGVFVWLVVDGVAVEVVAFG